MAATNPIEHSFELAAQRCEDLTPLVYHRLFQEHPEAEQMFRHEGGDLVKGSMLALAIEAIIDFSGNRTGTFRMIGCELESHNAYGTPRKLFGEFFGIMADAVRDVLGPDWTPDIDHAWEQVLGHLDLFIAEAELGTISGHRA
jgi:hemoglobin-like flavoprotein